MSAPVLDTKISAESDGFKANVAHNRALAERLRADVAQAALGGSQASRERHEGRGKLLPRDRVTRLLDPGSPFLEIGQLAANGMYRDGAPGAGVVVGIGRGSGGGTVVGPHRPEGEGGGHFPPRGEKDLAAPGNPDRD